MSQATVKTGKQPRGMSEKASEIIIVLLATVILVLVAYITGHCSVGYSLAAAC